MSTPKPSDLLERRELTARQLEDGSTPRPSRQQTAEWYGDGVFPERDARETAPLLRRAVPFWWDHAMVALAVASPLPANYTVPPLPFDAVWYSFETSGDPNSWGSVILGGRLPVLLAPTKWMQATYPGWEAKAFIAQLQIFAASKYTGTTVKRPNTNGAIRRLARKAIAVEDVHFVILRDIDPPAGRVGESEPMARDWKSRWLVRGHYRNQYYPSTNSHQTVWIASYIKGPGTLPIRLPAFRVAR